MNCDYLNIENHIFKYMYVSSSFRIIQAKFIDWVIYDKKNWKRERREVSCKIFYFDPTTKSFLLLNWIEEE